jgi:hypothetical protein
MVMSKDTCVHKFIIDSQNVGTCSLCGEVRQFPYEKGGQIVVLKEGKPKRKNQRGTTYMQLPSVKKHKYFEDNQDAIIADLLSQGRAAVRLKWDIGNSTLCKIEREWLTAEQRDRIPHAVSKEIPKTAPSTIAAGNGQLPAFPEFSGEWISSVQLKWLEVYGDLAKGGKISD